MHEAHLFRFRKLKRLETKKLLLLHRLRKDFSIEKKILAQLLRISYTSFLEPS
jgi:hypothetical protein